MVEKWSIIDLEEMMKLPERDEGLGEAHKQSVLRAKLRGFIKRRRESPSLLGLAGQQKVSALGRKRHLRKYSRKLVRNSRLSHAGPSRDTIDPDILVSQYRSSILLDALLPNRKVKWQPIHKRLKSRTDDLIEVKNFSFLTHPVETTSLLARIAESEAIHLGVQIDFHDEKCLDIGPWLVLAVMRRQMSPVFTGGGIHNSMSKVISELHLDRALRMQVSPKWSNKTDIWAFPVQDRRAAGTSSSKDFLALPQTKEKVGDALCKAVNEWLHECASQSLTQSGRGLVKNLVGESLDNAERHSRPDKPDDGDWMISGFMARRETTDGKAIFQCQLAFLSIGSPIDETIKDCATEIADEMKTYCKLHGKAMKSMNLADRHLRTVFALQDTVTRDKSASEERRGGTGLGDIIRFFGDLVGTDPASNGSTLAIVSGRTCLHIDFPYASHIGAKFGQLGNMWFNDGNSSKLPPDQEKVLELENEFAGTLITMGFILDADYLRGSINDQN